MDIIGIQGSSPGAGKDTAFEIIKEYAESKGKTVKRIAFGDKLKILALKALGLEGEDQSLLDYWDKNKHYGEIDILTYELEDGELWTANKETTLRKYVQNFGQELKKVDPYIWINSAEYPLDGNKEYDLVPIADVVVYTDIRFELEGRWIKEELPYLEDFTPTTLKMVYIDSDQRVNKDSNKDVEGWYDTNYIDVEIENNGTPEEFKEKVIKMLEEKYDW